MGLNSNIIHKNQVVVIFMDEQQMKKIENGTPGKGEVIDFLVIPKNLEKTWIKKFPNIALSLLPCLKQKTGKIIYY